MDSEGLGGVDKNQNYDVKIFTLAVLLSSFLIYNQVGVIDEIAITNLRYLLILISEGKLKPLIESFF